jgi:hypothetical protein
MEQRRLRFRDERGHASVQFAHCRVGPLLAILPGRDESGTGAVAGGVTNTGQYHRRQPTGREGSCLSGRLAGMDEIGARLQFGAFYNTYLIRSGA